MVPSWFLFFSFPFFFLTFVLRSYVDCFLPFLEVWGLLLAFSRFWCLWMQIIQHVDGFFLFHVFVREGSATSLLPFILPRSGFWIQELELIWMITLIIRVSQVSNPGEKKGGWVGWGGGEGGVCVGGFLDCLKQDDIFQESNSSLRIHDPFCFLNLYCLC